MELENRSLFRKMADNFGVIVAVGLVILGLYTYRFYVRENLIISILLLTTSTFSMGLIFGIWRKFTVKYAPNIIYWTTQHKWARKAVAGGSFSYYEYKPNVFKVGLFEPISRFITMMIGFLGISSTLANVMNLQPNPPVADISSAIIWGLLIVIVPILLTPIIPIIWAMEDLELKSWNEKWKTNVRVSRKYKNRFNSFIAIGTLGVAFTLSKDPDLTPLQNAALFFDLLQVALVALVYPIAVLTLLYYIYFRGVVIQKIRNKMSIPMAETGLIYRNRFGQILNEDGEIIAGKPDESIDVITALATGKFSPIEIHDENQTIGKAKNIASTQNTDNDDQNLPHKIGSSAKAAVTKTSDTVVNTGKTVIDNVSKVGKSISDKTIGRIFGNKKQDESGGSATAGLWDKDGNPNYDKAKEAKEQSEKEDKSDKKSKGGSATKGLWDD